MRVDLGAKVNGRKRGRSEKKVIYPKYSKPHFLEPMMDTVGWFKNPVSSQTEKLMAGTKFSDYLGLNHYKKAKKLKYFIHLGLPQGPQSFATYRSISPSGNLGNQLKNHVLVM